MAAEIERKFLLEVEPGWLGDCESRRIEQGYVALTEDAEVRVRLVDGGREAKLTVKRGEGRSRQETEIELIADQADRLWPLTDGRRVGKRRYRAEREEGCFEIDVYEGALAGLLTAEIEFADEAAAERFQPPEWLGPELTGDRRYANRSLAEHGRPDAG
jgi:adenylate cyclase